MLRVLKVFNIFFEVVISNDLEYEYMVMELVVLDCLGLLVEVGCIFFEYNVLIYSVCIVMLGEWVEDVFFISDVDGNMIQDLDLCE